MPSPRGRFSAGRDTEGQRDGNLAAALGTNPRPPPRQKPSRGLPSRGGSPKQRDVERGGSLPGRLGCLKTGSSGSSLISLAEGNGGYRPAELRVAAGKGASRRAPRRRREAGMRRALTEVLATLPRCVMFLLCFSLAIRIRCFATILSAVAVPAAASSSVWYSPSDAALGLWELRAGDRRRTVRLASRALPSQAAA